MYRFQYPVMNNHEAMITNLSEHYSSRGCVYTVMYND